MKPSLAAATALLLNSLAMPAAAAHAVAQGEAQSSTAAPGVDPDAQCAMFMRNIIVQMLTMGPLPERQRVYFDRYGVLFAYFSGRFSIGHDPAASLPLLTSTVQGLSREVQARMDCYHGGDDAMTGVQAQIDRAAAHGQAGGTPGSAPADPAGEDARCIAAVQRLINERARLSAREEMRNYNRVIWTVDYLAGRMAARSGATAFEPALNAAFAGLPADQAAADSLGFRCVADATRADDAFSAAIAAAEAAAEQAGPPGK